MRLGINYSISNSTLLGSALATPVTSFVGDPLIDDDGAYLIDDDGAYLVAA